MSDSIGPEDEEIQFETLIDRVKREGGEMLAAYKRRGFASREKVQLWRETAARGDRARSFLASEFWKRDLEPMLSAETRIKPCPKDALPDSIEKATIEYIDKSGAARQAEKIEKTMREWVEEGSKAAASLREEMLKRQSLEKPRV